MPALRDIRAYIPNTKYTNANEFPVPEYQRYPLMPLGTDGKPILNELGKPVIFNGPDEEEEFHSANPDVPRVQDPEDRQSELQRLRAEVAQFKAAKPAETGETDTAPAPSVSSLVNKPNSEKPKLTLGKKLD